VSLLDGLLLALVTFAGAAVQGATGFGFAILTIAFYLAILNSIAAVPLTIALSLAVSLAVAARVWRRAEPGLLLRLCLGSALGFLPGLAIYTRLDVEALKLVVAVLVGGFALYLLLARAAAKIGNGHPLADLAVGLVSGALTVCLGAPGPPVILYLAATGTAKEATRATVLALFCLSYAGALALQAATLGVPPEIWRAVLPLAPVAVVGGFAGHRLARHLSEAVFRRAVLLVLIAAGTYTGLMVVLG
jgi:uncharacterized protein